LSSIEETVAAIHAGHPVVLPFDTVYGLAADPTRPEPARRLYCLKGRPATQPSALVAHDLDALLELVPELRGLAETIARKLLPGPYTLVLPNPARRFRWLTGTSPDTIGVRVPILEGPGAEVLRSVGVLLATSANAPGGPEPAALADVPPELRGGVAAAVDGGTLLGVPSTVLDLSGDEPRVLREGAIPAAEALRRLGAPVRSR
jgi:L-threonylcarbamoyladenylate synthase